MVLFSAEFHGELRLEHVPHDFTERMAHRVEGGLHTLMGSSRAVNNYAVTRSALDALEFYFEGYAWRGSEMHPGWGCISWLLYDLTLTCYGELALEQSTWGAIKQSMR